MAAFLSMMQVIERVLVLGKNQDRDIASYLESQGSLGPNVIVNLAWGLIAF
jgi:hypothetical protein